MDVGRDIAEQVCKKNALSIQLECVRIVTAHSLYINFPFLNFTFTCTKWYQSRAIGMIHAKHASKHAMQ